MAARKKIIQALENILMRKHALKTDLAEPYLSVQASINLDSSAVCFVFTLCSILHSMITKWLKTHFIWNALNKNCKSSPDTECIMDSQMHVKHSAMKTHLNSSASGKSNKIGYDIHGSCCRLYGWVKSFLQPLLPPPEPKPKPGHRPTERNSEKSVRDNGCISLVRVPQHICNFCYQNLLKTKVFKGQFKRAVATGTCGTTEQLVVLVLGNLVGPAAWSHHCYGAALGLQAWCSYRVSRQDCLHWGQGDVLYMIHAVVRQCGSLWSRLPPQAGLMPQDLPPTGDHMDVCDPCSLRQGHVDVNDVSTGGHVDVCGPCWPLRPC